MVEYNFSLDEVFGSLADPTRRDILERVAAAELTVGEIALPYDLSLAAVSKHLKILEKARLIIKRRRGKQQLVTAAPAAIEEARDYLESYRQQWEERFERLEQILSEESRS